ncbi:High-affinity leucine-specific transport system, periplasmic binding protein LivK [Cystobacter fuscus DSM 2262]|uniref:High-affinity leucine-specific transport system, periplasmic binding protein LivK n=1 Tax=Cystobacter fuscus (strain ATCC 25194 / DSM 2262 / NBRC 100088 / M29) TaxID=1242864 RepID=S9P897_CYSF2|nr:High-affinity leucine-specific transport system, periplasmic binding protein LivK [Cystobacter fuscus DSM 2262]
MQGETINSSVVKLDSGLVLMVGGRPKEPPPPEGNWDEETKKKMAFSALYDPEKNEWKKTGDIVQPRQLASAVKLSTGEVMLSGGKCPSSGRFINAVELYDPVAGTWKTISDWENPRYGHQSTLLPSGKVLVTGGRVWSKAPSGKEGEASTTGAELYDPATHQWSSAGGMIQSMRDATLTLLGSGEVMVLSSHGVEIYNPESNTWRREKAPPFVALHGHAATHLDSGELLVTGGTNGYSLSSTALYDPSEKTWVAGPPLNQAHWNHKTIALTGGKALVIGGFGDIELYTPPPTSDTDSKGSWTHLAKTPRPYNKGNAILLPKNKVLLWGAMDEEPSWLLFTLPE